jgi:hypothetical protein
MSSTCWPSVTDTTASTVAPRPPLAKRASPPWAPETTNRADVTPLGTVHVCSPTVENVTVTSATAPARSPIVTDNGDASTKTVPSRRRSVDR